MPTLTRLVSCTTGLVVRASLIVGRMTEHSRFAYSPHSGPPSPVTGEPSPSDGQRGEREPMTFRRNPNIIRSLPRDGAIALPVVESRYRVIWPRWCHGGWHLICSADNNTKMVLADLALRSQCLNVSGNRPHPESSRDRLGGSSCLYCCIILISYAANAG